MHKPDGEQLLKCYPGGRSLASPSPSPALTHSSTDQFTLKGRKHQPVLSSCPAVPKDHLREPDPTPSQLRGCQNDSRGRALHTRQAQGTPSFSPPVAFYSGALGLSERGTNPVHGTHQEGGPHSHQWSLQMRTEVPIAPR